MSIGFDKNVNNPKRALSVASHPTPDSLEFRKFTERTEGRHHSFRLARYGQGMFVSTFDIASSLDERIVEFESVVNFRDLGGLPTIDGFVRTQALYRCATLHLTSTNDSKRLDDLGIRTVIDLRTTEELDRWPSQGAWVSPTVRHAPLLRTTWSADQVEEAQTAAEFLAARYIDMMLQSPEVLASTLQFLAETSEPAVFHCAAGKDRTGVLAAVLLGILGVDDEVIARDYHLSAAAMTNLFRLFSSSETDSNTMVGQPSAFLEAPYEAMMLVLDWVGNEWGSMATYAVSNGTAPKVISALRNRLVVK